MKRRSWLTVVATVAVLALVASACSNDDGTGGEPTAGGDTGATADEFGVIEIGPDEPINLGVAQVISGADAALGTDQVNGINLAVDYLDNTFDATPGTLLDHPVELKVEDELCSAEGGQAAGTALAADPTIVGVIGTSCSSAALGVADTILGDKGILLFSGSNTSPALTDPEAHQPFYARTAHNDRIQGAIVAEFALKEGATKMATIHDESPYTQGLTAAAAVNFEAGDGTVTVQEQINSEDTDFKPVLQSIADTDPDVLYAPVFVAACSLILKQAADIMPDVTIMASDGCQSTDTIKTAGEDAIEGVFLSGPDTSAYQEGEFYSNEFLPAYEEQFSTQPTSVFHAHAFDATNILFDAIEQVAVQNEDGSLEISRTELRDAVFATSGYEGLSGIITCDEFGDCATDVVIGIFEGPNWPVEGGTGDGKPVYTDTKSLDDVL
jgi:branched-chain amino acid transport system substrate-binding protein